MNRVESKTYLDFFLTNWTQLLSLATILTSLFGAWSANNYYSSFNVNYLELAELNDFIKHLVSRPYLALLFITLLITFVFQLYFFKKSSDNFIKLQRFYRNKKQVKNIRFKVKYHILDFSTILFKSIILWGISLPLTYSILNLEFRSFESTDFTLYNVNTDTIPLICSSYIGKINTNHIFVDRTNRVIIIPSSSLKSITFFASLAKRPKEFVADNHVRTNEYLNWEKHIKETCGKEFEIPAIRS